MPITKEVNKEAVRMLVAQIGYKETEKRTGIAANTLYQWAKRFAWNAPIPHVQDTVRTVREPSVILAETLAEHERKTKLGLSAYARRQAEHLAERGELKDHGAFRNLAAGSSTLHGWAESKQSAVFSLNVLNLNLLSEAEPPALDD